VYDNAVYPTTTSSSFLSTAGELQSSISSGTKPAVNAVRQIDPSPDIKLKRASTNAVVSLAYETAMAGKGALVFCSSRQGCEIMAEIISEVMPERAETGEELWEQRKDVERDLRNTSVGLDGCLEKTLARGVAFHHAGLTAEERNIIHAAYDSGAIKVLVATCSLAAGVNIPARRVILNGARMGRELVGPAMLRQMRGRAGRKGKDEIGETFLCCEKADLEQVSQLLEADMPSVGSCLVADKKGIVRALLEVIATRLASTDDNLLDYVRHTLLYHITKDFDAKELVKETITTLRSTSLITLTEHDTYEATLLGHAIVSSSLTPAVGIFIHEELQRAIRAFVMDGELHVFYMFTPVQTDSLVDIDWRLLRTEMENLDESGLRVMQYIGIKPSVINKLAHGGQLPETTPAEISTARTYRRFYAALQLRDLCNELPVHAVAKKYRVPRGSVQTLSQTCQGFGAGMVKFCERMEWGMLSVVLEHMSDRLRAGAKADLLELAKVAYVKSRTARIFWENGLKSVKMVAEADVKDIVPILMLAQPKKFRLEGDDHIKYHEKLLLKAEIIVSSANRVWTKQLQMDVLEEEY
jgi:replicative superfamily II helicase